MNRLSEDAGFLAGCREAVPRALAALDAGAEWRRLAALYNRLRRADAPAAPSDGHARAEAAECPRDRDAAGSGDTVMRILHAPANVGNQPWVLSRYERQLGHVSDLWVNLSTSFAYPADRVLVRPNDPREEQLRARLLAGLQVPLDYDAFHFYFGRTILGGWDEDDNGIGYRYLDLELAHRLDKPIVFTLQGCDARLASELTRRYAHTPCRDGVCDIYPACIATHDFGRRRLIAEVLPKADRVFFLNPELGHYVPDGQFLPYASVDIAAIDVCEPHLDRPPRIVHAPSNGSIKGTPAILAALEALRPEREFELVLVHDMTHAEAMRVYRTADLVIDQVLAGWYGGFAVEAMAMGKPVLCYLREEDFDQVPAELIADLPIRNLRPDRLADDIAAALDRRKEWPDWSRRSRRFVEKWHNPRLIAAAMIDLYRDPGAPFTLSRHIVAAEDAATVGG